MKRNPISFQGHMFIFKVTGVKIRTILAIFDPFLPFPDNNSTGNCHMTMKRDIQLLGDMDRCPIYFEGHMLKFKVTPAKNLANFDPFRSFPDNNVRFKGHVNMKWSVLLLDDMHRCPISFKGHMSMVKVTGVKT